ncbi:MAG: hypothetical protein MI723_08005 [Caulobacterales bacterium]|nr:hypothetical protein [Caulobacterales bacterium]
MEWIRELRRRRVFRGMGTYVVVAWVVWVFLGPELPPALRGYLMWLLIFGAPLAGLFSWMFRVRPGELELEHHHDGAPPATALSRALDLGVIAGLAVVVVASLILAINRPSAPPAAAEDPPSRLYVPIR